MENLQIQKPAMGTLQKLVCEQLPCIEVFLNEYDFPGF